MNGENDNPKPLRLGKVVPYYVTLKMDRGFPSEERASRFREKEWQLGDPFVAGFEPADRVEDIVYLEYVEAKKVLVHNFGEREEVLSERRCKIFDLMENNKEGFILVHPNGVSKNQDHLKRYLTRIGYTDGKYEFWQILYDSSQLLKVFYSSEVERRGIKFETGPSQIEFWTATDLTKDIYYNSCKKVEINGGELKARKNIETEDIIRIAVKIRSEESGKESSSEIIVYKDHIVSLMSSHRIETWNHIKRLLRLLEEAR